MSYSIETNNQKKSPKRVFRLIASKAVTVIAVVANVTQIQSGLLPKGIANSTIPSKALPSLPLNATGAMDQELKRKPSPNNAQISLGAQSPNIRKVHGTVDLAYEGASAPKDSSPSPGSVLIPNGINKHGSALQMSVGFQSPNIEEVGKDVKLRYGSLADDN